MDNRTPERKRAEEKWAAIVASGEASRWIPNSSPDRYLRVEALRAAAVPTPNGRTAAMVARDAEVLYQWLSGGERGVDEAPGRYVAEHVLDADRRTGTTSAHRVVGEE